MSKLEELIAAGKVRVGGMLPEEREAMRAAQRDSSVIARVTRGLRDASARLHRLELADDSPLSPYELKHYGQLAAAALQAMREPTEAMLTSALHAVFGGQPPAGIDERDMRTAWDAMIAVASKCEGA